MSVHVADTSDLNGREKEGDEEQRRKMYLRVLACKVTFSHF